MSTEQTPQDVGWPERAPARPVHETAAFRREVERWKKFIAARGYIDTDYGPLRVPLWRRRTDA